MGGVSVGIWVAGIRSGSLGRGVGPDQLELEGIQRRCKYTSGRDAI